MVLKINTNNALRECMFKIQISVIFPLQRLQLGRVNNNKKNPYVKYKNVWNIKGKSKIRSNYFLAVAAAVAGDDDDDDIMIS